MIHYYNKDNYYTRMSTKIKEQRVGKEEPEFQFDIGTVIFILIGLATSWINMLIILDFQLNASSAQLKINAYLSVIFTTIVPGIGIALKNRFWGYGYMIGFAIAGLPFMFVMDLFIGGYTFFTALFIFIILWLIFWKAWRSLGSIKM